MYSMRGKVDVGDRAPEFRAKDALGRDINNATFLGRGNLVLFFYSNSRCQACLEEMRDLTDKYDLVTRQDAEIVAISTDGIDIAKNMALDLPYRVISDPKGDIIKLYGVYDDNTDAAYPAVFLIDKNGVVRYRKIIGGPDDMVHAAEIVNRLKDLGSPQGKAPFKSSRYL